MRSIQSRATLKHAAPPEDGISHVRLRKQHQDICFSKRRENAYDFPGFVPAYIRPLFCEGRGPFRWVALSGEPSDIHSTDDLVLELFPDNRILRRWIDLARKRIKFQGLPARICWLGYGERAQFGLAMNDMVKKGRLKAPIVMGRDHLDCGSVASPFRETERMKDAAMQCRLAAAQRSANTARCLVGFRFTRGGVGIATQSAPVQFSRR